VALGRAIVRRPKAFLFDEPLSNLDAKLRVQMRTEIVKLHLKLQATMIYVTHDQVEAMTMGDRIVVMKDGIIMQVADPISLYEKPANKFVAGFLGNPPMNFLNGTVVKKDGGLYFKEGDAQLTIAEEMADKLHKYEGQRVVFGIRPEDIYDKLFVGDASPGNTTIATVDVVEPMGSEIYLHLTTGAQTITARVDAHSKVQEGQKLEIVFNMSKVHFFDPETEATII
jgi:multiple sugar transport system ATP-binding protein